MASVKICDGRMSLWQYDTGVKIEMCGCSSVTECHFVTEKGVIRRDVTDNICDVPDAALVTAGMLVVYAFARTADEGTTRHEFRANVQARPKPADYIDPPDEIENLDALAERVAIMIEPEPHVETDPTVPDWAKQPEKPTYTAQEVGAQPAGDYALKSELHAPYSLPTASADTLGGVKVGEGLQMTGDVLGVKENEWELIEKITINEEGLKSVTRTECPNGIPYNLSAVKVIANLYYPLTEQVATAVRFVDKDNTELGYVVARIPKGTYDDPQYKSTGIYQAKPAAGLYEFTSMTCTQGEVMSVSAPANGNYQTTSTNKKIAKIVFLRWDNKTIPVGTQLRIWGVRANA